MDISYAVLCDINLNSQTQNNLYHYLLQRNIIQYDIHLNLSISVAVDLCKYCDTFVQGFHKSMKITVKMFLVPIHCLLRLW